MTREDKEKAFYEKCRNINLVNSCLIEFEYTPELGAMCGVGGDGQLIVMGIYTIIEKLCRNTGLEFEDVIDALGTAKKLNDGKVS